MIISRRKRVELKIRWCQWFFLFYARFHASNLINSDEYQLKIKELEQKQQEKLQEAEKKMENLMESDRVKQKIADFEEKKRQMEEKLAQMKHQL